MAESSKSKSMERALMGRPGLGMEGTKISLLSNHFGVNVSRNYGHFYQYDVSFYYSDMTPADAKGVGRKVLDKLHEIYYDDLARMHFAYDGEKTLFTIGALPQNKEEFNVTVEERSSVRRTGTGADGGSPRGSDRKRSRKNAHMKNYRVEIKYTTKIPIMAIADVLRGQTPEQFQQASRVLDVILRQHASKQGCLLVKQSFFHNQVRNFVDLGGGAQGCRGIYSGFRATQNGLSLNMDLTTTMTVRPGPAIDFLCENQKVDHPSKINWKEAEKTLKNLMIETTHTKLEYKIRGLTREICRRQMFSMKNRLGEHVELTVYEYYVNHRKMPLRTSGNFPCIDVGKRKKPVYIPIELCNLVSLQRYTKAITNLQRAALVEKSRQKPQERMHALTNAFNASRYDTNPLLQSLGVQITSEFTRVEGRILKAPELRVGGSNVFVPSNGKWNFNSKTLIRPAGLERWAIVNFSSQCDMRRLSGDLIRCGRDKGMSIAAPRYMLLEKPEYRRKSTPERIYKMIEMLGKDLSNWLQFLLCILPEKKNSVLYGPWKRAILCDFGVATQCLSPAQAPNNQYLTNLLLKINAKLGGSNSLLQRMEHHLTSEHERFPTLIVGMDVSHGSPDYSTAAVVNSRKWPYISRYRATVRTQAPKTEMIDKLVDEVGNSDRGIFRDVLMDFYTSSNKKPVRIIIFRDGVGEGQFKQVLDIELEQIMKACKLLKDTEWEPKFTVIVAQKRHQTRFFQSNSGYNVPAGTVVDTGVCHPKNFDFFLCSQAGPIGTTRPTHYHVLYDETGFPADSLQELIHSLAYVYQRSTTIISGVAPIRYAHLAAEQMAKFINSGEYSDRSSSQGGEGSVAAVTPLPKLKGEVSKSMFFC